MEYYFTPDLPNKIYIPTQKVIWQQQQVLLLSREVSFLGCSVGRFFSRVFAKTGAVFPFVLDNFKKSLQCQVVFISLI